ncbi:MAG: DeoR/GlpR family DNA-binding transcription regulator [Sporolactobacillus sp.]
MYQEERLAAILDSLKTERSMSVNEICEKFQISRDTARRDIVKLCEKRTAIRTHGGIALPELEQTLLAYRERLMNYSLEKMQIGAQALSFLQENGHYFFNASTTLSCMVRQIDRTITAYTHGLDTAQILSDRSKIEIHLFGGMFNSTNRYFAGMHSLEQIRAVNFDGAFLGTASITPEGFFYDDEDDAEVIQTVCNRSALTVILAEQTKFTKKSRYMGTDWKTADIIITDKEPSTFFRKQAEKTGTEIILAPLLTTSNEPSKN